MTPSISARRYDLDWLRIGAFALLVPYHVGMYYTTWDWHIKSPAMSHALEPFMLLTAPWRLSLLFFIAGVAFAYAMRTRGGGLAWSRSKRLLIPLLFGMFVVVVPQVYLELKEKMPGFDMPAWAFYQRYLQGGDIYCVRPHDCIDAPTWNHLWFVAYLWLYTLLACGLAKCIPTSAKAHWVSLSEKYLGGLATLLVPMCLLVLARVWLYPLFDSTHDLDDDWYNHAQYGVAFVTGLAIAFNERAWHTIYAARRWMTVLWAICYLTFLACFLVFDSDTGSVPALALATQRALWGVMTWAAICAITGYAMRWRHTDSRWRAWLTEAVFPLYILHQTVIILLAWNVRSLHLPWLIEYVALIALTFCICFAAFGLIRRVPWLRPFFGLRFRLAGGVAPSIARHHPRANHPAPIDRQA